MHAIDALKRNASELEARSVALDDAMRRDPLSDVDIRDYLHQRLASEFAAAQTGGWSLGILFVEFDLVTRTNDTNGHRRATSC